MGITRSSASPQSRSVIAREHGFFQFRRRLEGAPSESLLPGNLIRKSTILFINDLPYEVINRSKSGSGCSNSLCSLGHRRDRSRAKRTWNRRAEPDELARIPEFFVRAERKRREPTSRPRLRTVEAGVSPAFPKVAADTAATTVNHRIDGADVRDVGQPRDFILAKSRSISDAA